MAAESTDGGEDGGLVETVKSVGKKAKGAVKAAVPEANYRNMTRLAATAAGGVAGGPVGAGFGWLVSDSACTMYEAAEHDGDRMVLPELFFASSVGFLGFGTGTFSYTAGILGGYALGSGSLQLAQMKDKAKKGWNNPEDTTWGNPGGDGLEADGQGQPQDRGREAAPEQQSAEQGVDATDAERNVEEPAVELKATAETGGTADGTERSGSADLGGGDRQHVLPARFTKIRLDGSPGRTASPGS